jgi:hypothetical protein
MEAVAKRKIPCPCQELKPGRPEIKEMKLRLKIINFTYNLVISLPLQHMQLL